MYLQRVLSDFHGPRVTLLDRCDLLGERSKKRCLPGQSGMMRFPAYNAH
jgi:hypothetical protein